MPPRRRRSRSRRRSKSRKRRASRRRSRRRSKSRRRSRRRSKSRRKSRKRSKSRRKSRRKSRKRSRSRRKSYQYTPMFIRYSPSMYAMSQRSRFRPYVSTGPGRSTGFTSSIFAPAKTSVPSPRQRGEGPLGASALGSEEPLKLTGTLRVYLTEGKVKKKLGDIIQFTSLKSDDVFYFSSLGKKLENGKQIRDRINCILEKIPLKRDKNPQSLENVKVNINNNKVSFPRTNKDIRPQDKQLSFIKYNFSKDSFGCVIYPKNIDILEKYLKNLKFKEFRVAEEVVDSIWTPARLLKNILEKAYSQVFQKRRGGFTVDFLGSIVALIYLTSTYLSGNNEGSTLDAFTENHDTMFWSTLSAYQIFATLFPYNPLSSIGQYYERAYKWVRRLLPRFGKYFSNDGGDDSSDSSSSGDKSFRTAEELKSPPDSTQSTPARPVKKKRRRRSICQNFTGRKMLGAIMVGLYTFGIPFRQSQTNTSQLASENITDQFPPNTTSGTLFQNVTGRNRSRSGSGDLSDFNLGPSTTPFGMSISDPTSLSQVQNKSSENPFDPRLQSQTINDSKGFPLF